MTAPSDEHAAANRRLGWALFAIFAALSALSIGYIVVYSLLRGA